MNNNNRIRSGIYPFSQDYRDYSLVVPNNDNSNGEKKQPNTNNESFAERFRKAFKTALKATTTSFASISSHMGTPYSEEEKELLRNSGSTRGSENVRDDAITSFVGDWNRWEKANPGGYTYEKDSFDKKELLNDYINFHMEEDGLDPNDEALRNAYVVNTVSELRNRMNNVNQDKKRAGKNLQQKDHYRTPGPVYNGIAIYVADKKNERKKQMDDAEKVEFVYEPGETFGQKIIDLGLATDNGLWGDNGDVAYYTQQLWDQGALDENGNLRIGKTITLRKRK